MSCCPPKEASQQLEKREAALCGGTGWLAGGCRSAPATPEQAALATSCSSASPSSKGPQQCCWSGWPRAARGRRKRGAGSTRAPVGRWPCVSIAGKPEKTPRTPNGQEHVPWLGINLPGLHRRSPKLTSNATHESVRHPRHNVWL